MITLALALAYTLRQMNGKAIFPLKKKYPLLEQLPPDKGGNMKKLHIHIMNI
jgi:hypothetical protein